MGLLDRAPIQGDKGAWRLLRGGDRLTARSTSSHSLPVPISPPPCPVSPFPVLLLHPPLPYLLWQVWPAPSVGLKQCCILLQCLENGHHQSAVGSIHSHFVRLLTLAFIVCFGLTMFYHFILIFFIKHLYICSRSQIGKWSQLVSGDGYGLDEG